MSRGVVAARCIPEALQQKVNPGPPSRVEAAVAEGHTLHCQPPASPSSPPPARLRGTDPSVPLRAVVLLPVCLHDISPRTDRQPMDSADTLGLGFSLLFWEKRNWAVELIFCCFCF